MISNTAVPRYYAKFREDVLSGHIPVCREIEMEMNRVDEWIADPNIYYDDEAVEGWIRFCEQEMTLTDGSELHLLDTFKLWGEQLFGWWYFVEQSVYVPDETGGGHYEQHRIRKRMINKQYLIVARSNAKSLYSALVHMYFLTIDTTTTQQIVTAPTMKQAEETTSPMVTAIKRSRGPLFSFLTEGSLQNTSGPRATRRKLDSTKRGVENFLTNSIVEVRPMSIGKLQGLRCKVATVDEWLSTDIREDVVGALEQGAAKTGNYVMVMTSSEGTVRNGAGDEIKLELMSLLKGDATDPHTSIWYYRLDDVKEVADPSKWVKACPNIGITVSYETYQRDVERAERNPSARNDILAKRFGIPLEGYTYFFTYEETIPHRRKDFWNLPCVMGADLSRGDDFCAFTFLFPQTNGDVGVKSMCYISEHTIKQLPSVLRMKYEEFINEGSLRVLPGTVLDMLEVYADLDREIEERGYDVMAMGYDPYNAKDFVAKWGVDRGEYGIEKVIQGARTESVPLGELKHLAETRALIFDQEIVSFCLGNCITLEDTNGNRKLYKQRADQKIDAVSAMMDAWVAYKLHREDFE